MTAAEDTFVRQPPGKELTYDEAFNWLRDIFHRTRYTHNLSVPPNVVHGILYGRKQDDPPV